MVSERRVWAISPELREYRVGIIPNFEQKSTKKGKKLGHQDTKAERDLPRRTERPQREIKVIRHRFHRWTQIEKTKDLATESTENTEKFNIFRHGSAYGG